MCGNAITYYAIAARVGPHGKNRELVCDEEKTTEAESCNKDGSTIKCDALKRMCRIGVE